MEEKILPLREGSGKVLSLHEHLIKLDVKKQKEEKAFQTMILESLFCILYRTLCKFKWVWCKDSLLTTGLPMISLTV